METSEEELARRVVELKKRADELEESLQADIENLLADKMERMIVEFSHPKLDTEERRKALDALKIVPNLKENT